MKLASILVVGVLILLMVAFAYSLFTYSKEARQLPSDLEGRMDWKEAVSDARHYRIYEPVACVFLLTLFSLFLALLKLPRISWLRTVLASVLTVAVVYLGFITVMDREVRQRDQTFVLPPSAVWDAIWFALLGVAIAGALLFTIERIYVRRIAPNA